MDVVPINIRPHLIPFLFNEFEGTEARYLNRHVKSVKITTNSSIGFMFGLLLQKADYPLKPEKYNMFISLTKIKNKKVYKAKMYKTVSGKNSFLRVQPQHAEDFNELLEDIFRISFVHYIEGAVENQTQKRMVVDTAIKKFMQKHELDEYNFTVSSLRRLYHRTRKKKHKIARMQKQPANRIKKYAMS